MRTVLVVDEDPVIRGLVRAVLENEQYEVLQASSGNDALKLAHRIGVDAIILDCMGRRCEGLATLKQWRADPITTSVPVLAMTGLGQHGSEVGLWANSVLIKPFRPAQLLLKMQTLWRVTNEPPPTTTRPFVTAV
jgi:DNA-binding response OmpR family regulator